jgi:hypothetical protein
MNATDHYLMIRKFKYKAMISMEKLAPGSLFRMSGNHTLGRKRVVESIWMPVTAGCISLLTM